MCSPDDTTPNEKSQDPYSFNWPPQRASQLHNPPTHDEIMDGLGQERCMINPLHIGPHTDPSEPGWWDDSMPPLPKPGTYGFTVETGPLPKQYRIVDFDTNLGNYPMMDPVMGCDVEPEITDPWASRLRRMLANALSLVQCWLGDLEDRVRP